MKMFKKPWPLDAFVDGDLSVRGSLLAIDGASRGVVSFFGVT